ncbi:uncharacterized protein LOC123553419 isoform X2 [Mercenaria mercenaria]|uniref:uncharacterized protein LOC123553419 isoform X2 n=1 Tax=Mercenaria mercenaria TaxID=6596 RepID=UPI00234E8C60|nr:uncharacterized protein LOC123553419 isoform X2 [Mercenaria mercenaria]
MKILVTLNYSHVPRRAFIGGIHAEQIVTFSRANMCNETILLGTTHHASIIDFRVSTLSLEPYSRVCNLYVETTNTPYIGMKFLSTNLDVAYSNASQCSSELSITGKDMEQIHYNTLPEFEININTYGYVNLEIKLDKCMINSNTSLFRVLVFKHGDTFCFSEEIHCINSTRCVHPELACTNVYDFCDNDFQNCKNKSDSSTNKRYRRRGPPSIPGIVLGLTCLTVLTSFLLYIVLCRKRPCCRRITQKLQCRLPPCESCGDGTTERTTATAQFIRETDHVSLHYTRFRDPPPSYCDLHPNQHGQGGNAHPQFETGISIPNIPPPLYSSENTNETDVQDDLPPPYSVAPPATESLQHM